MSSHPLRSSSVGALPREKRHTTSRAESSTVTPLDVRCGCQYYQSDSLLPDRVNPVGSRPESQIGFTSQERIFPTRPGIQYDAVSNRSFGLGKIQDADKESIRSFRMGRPKRRSFGQMSARSFGIEKPTFDQISNKGLVVASIADAGEPVIGITSDADKISIRNFGSNAQIPGKDPDTISTHSFGLKRISRTPSNTDLFVADINIPTPIGSRRGSKIEIPQFHVIAPTPTMEMRSPFHSHDPRPGGMDKENKLFSVYDESNPTSQYSSTLPFSTPSKQRKLSKKFGKAYSEEFSPSEPQIQKEIITQKSEDNASSQKEYTNNQQSSNSASQDVQMAPKETDYTYHPRRTPLKETQEASKVQEEMKKETSKPPKTEEQVYSVSQEIVAVIPKITNLTEHISRTTEENRKLTSKEEKIRFRAEELSQYMPSNAQTQSQREAENARKRFKAKQRSASNLYYGAEQSNQRTEYSSQENESCENLDRMSESIDDFSFRPVIIPHAVPPPAKVYEEITPTIPESFEEPVPTRSSEQEHQVKPLSKPSELPYHDEPTTIKPQEIAPQLIQEQTFSFNITVQPEKLPTSEPKPTPTKPPKISDTKKSFQSAKPQVFSEIIFRTEDLPQYSQPKLNFTSTPRAPSESGSQQQLDAKILRSNLLRRKQYFNRTQSQDRAPSIGGSFGDIRSNRMIKTVSFDFAKNSAQKSLQQKSNSNSTSRDKRDWIESSYFMRDHEYEPIGQPLDEIERSNQEKEPSPIPTVQVSEPMEVEETIVAEKSSIEQRLQSADASSLTSLERRELEAEEEAEPSALDQQKEVEERYFSSIPTTPRTDSRTDNEIHTSQVDSSAIEELPLRAEDRKKGFMASAQDRSRKMQENIRSQAGKLRTKLRGTKKPPPSGSPKAKERKRFKAPDFSKLKMPEIKRPELPKFKTPEMPKFKAPEFKRPEFTKFDKPIFTKPDMSKFKVPDRIAIKLRRTKSLKETEVVTTTDTSPESAPMSKKKFEFNFGTYPRMLRKKRQKLSTQVIARADDFPSTESPPSVESATIPRAPRDKGPVGSRWADKFSDVSYADSESGKYQRYGSEVESLGRESSVEQRMKDDLERAAREEEELERTVEQQQFAEYNEENRAIHEISKIREDEFKKRKPILHQDSDLVSDEGKDIGWTEKDILRNTLLRRDDVDIEHLQEPYPSEEGLAGSNTNTNQETQSTGSSGVLRQKGVLEEIDDDEFFLRKRGISQDNIEIRQYISTAIREGLGTPSNALAKLGTSESYPEMDISNEQVHYGYDVPPPKPRRSKNFNNFDRDTESREISQDYSMERKGSFDDNTSLPQTDDHYFGNYPPSRPLRRSKKQYSEDSQEDHEVPMEEIPYFDDGDERMFFKKVNVPDYDHEDQDIPYHDEQLAFSQIKATPPKVPRRRKKPKRESIEKDSYANRFSGRSISNSFLQNEEHPEEIIVYRTQHEYTIPLAHGETFTAPVPTPRRSRSRSQSQSRITDDDRTSRGAESLTSDNHLMHEDKFHVEMKENDGYAIVRKEPPPRPPAPNRRKRSSSPFNDRHFATMPHMKKETSVPERPKRNYSTIGPSRPPRRKSSTNMGDAQINVSSPDVTQYEELDIDEDEEDRMDSPRDLHSGDVINKMKYRPLPPPPRPPREGRKHRDPRSNFDDKHDKDGGGEKIFSDIQRNGNYDVEKFTDKCIEVEVSTQTDPLPDDFCCEEFEITDDMRIIEPRRTKTLEDILKEEQEAELERARQLADDDSLIRGIQRFREAGQRSFSERSKGSTADRSKASISRPTTPSAIVIERRVPTPIPHRGGETLLEATLTVFPVEDIDLDPEEQYEEEKHEQDEAILSESGETNQEEEQRLSSDHISDREISPEIEKSIERESTPEDEEVPPPLPPPRKRSSITSELHQQEEERKELEAQETALLPVTQEIEHPPEQPALPSRLAIAELEVERLSVNALQAGRIVVSQLQGSSITADEFECKSSNLPSRTLDLPPGFIEEIIERVRSTEREQIQAQQQSEVKPPQPAEEKTTSPEPTTEQPPVRPPPPQQPLFPSEYMQFSVPPPSFYHLRNPSEEELHHSPTHRRRRHHRRRDSSSDDDVQREHRRSRHSTRSPEPSIGQLGGQLLSACGSSMLRAMTQIANLLRTNEKEGSERHISTAIVLVILMTIGFLLLGITGDKNIHHHHWDYFNPPGNQGRE